ncbi:MAG: hypothetical protein EXS08_08430 [Planctomycetes bacterium]|nr:hypothetical protein [Planctomycetota bacterium]
MSGRLALVVLALVVGCAQEPRSSEEAAARLAVLEAHRAVDISPAGDWVTIAGEEDWWVHIELQQDSRTWAVRCSEMLTNPAPARSEASRPFTQTATLADGILTLDSTFAGSTRFHLARFGKEELLLPENAVRFEEHSERPYGLVFERVDDLEGWRLTPYSPGPEDEGRWDMGLPR